MKGKHPRRWNWRWLLSAVPLILFFAAWYAFTFHNSTRAFFFGSPDQYLTELLGGIFRGNLIQDTWTTGVEAAVGFAIGNIGGIFLGLSLWRLRGLSQVL